MGAPGNAIAFHMDKESTEKPYIILSGDDAGVVDLLIPSSQSDGDWTYSKQTLYTSHEQTGQGVSTIGTILVADVQGTGKPQLFVSSYAENKLEMFSFEASTILV